jgi:hypothetical protein
LNGWLKMLSVGQLSSFARSFHRLCRILSDFSGDKDVNVSYPAKITGLLLLKEARTDATAESASRWPENGPTPRVIAHFYNQNVVERRIYQ